MGMQECLGTYLPKHGQDLSPYTRATLALSSVWGATEYVQAQRVRAEMMSAMQTLFESVDVIATPATGTVAPPINQAALKTGQLDGNLLGRIARFAPLANLTGIPGISFPAGYTAVDRKPINIQLMASWWEEHTLLRCAIAAEEHAKRAHPKVS